jgi:hypothetical protein
VVRGRRRVGVRRRQAPKLLALAIATGLSCLRRRLSARPETVAPPSERGRDDPAAPLSPRRRNPKERRRKPRVPVWRPPRSSRSTADN